MRFAAIVVLTLTALAARPTESRAQAAKPSPAAASTGPTRSLAQTLTGPAKADYQTGKLLLIDGDFGGALIKLQSAYDASKDPRLLWNIAACQKGQRHYAKALALLKRYVDEGGRLLTAGDRRDAQDLVALLQQLTSKMTFNVNESGAEVFVDDESIGTTPLTASPVIDVGERRLRVTKDGFVPFEKMIPVGGSADVAVEVKLTPDVHVGHLIVNAPTGATVLMDEKPLGQGHVDLTVPSGGHQLRVTAPGMRPFRSEVFVQDKETRSLDVILEHDAALELPKIRVAVGCGDDEPRGIEDGLVAYLDGPDVIQPVGTKREWDAELGRNVVRYVEYGATAGTHTIRIRAPGCTSLERSIVVDERDGVKVDGALQRDDFPLLRGAQGSPGWWRVALSMWLPVANSNGQTPTYASHLGDMKGAKLAFSVVGRWFQADVSAAVAGGSIDGKASPSSLWQRYGVRAGPRVPLGFASIGIGVSLAPTLIVVRGQDSTLGLEYGAYLEIDVQPTCDVGLFMLGSAGASSAATIGAIDLGVFLEPSRACKNARDTPFGLRAAQDGHGAALAPK